MTGDEYIDDCILHGYPVGDFSRFWKDIRYAETLYVVDLDRLRQVPAARQPTAQGDAVREVEATIAAVRLVEEYTEVGSYITDKLLSLDPEAVAAVLDDDGQAALVRLRQQIDAWFGLATTTGR